jgi:hypothetical protein
LHQDAPNRAKDQAVASRGMDARFFFEAAKSLQHDRADVVFSIVWSQNEISMVFFEDRLGFGRIAVAMQCT